MISGFLFNPGGKRGYVIAGDELLAPTEDTAFWRVYRVDGDTSDLVYAVAAFRIEDVRALTAEQIDALHAQDEGAEQDSRAQLTAALDHIEQVIGPWAAKPCQFVDGAILEGGITTCVTHNRPGSKPGTCGVAEAIAFVDQHRETA